MKYYKVRPEFDGVQVLKVSYRGHFRIDRYLIGRELYTEKELEKLMIGADFRGCGIRKDTVIFDPVEIPRTQVYWFFGARFAASDGPVAGEAA